MIKPSEISPDVALSTFLTDKISVGTKKVVVYSDWSRPTNKLPDDFIVVTINGDVIGVGMDTPFAKGYLIVLLYCKMNEDGSVKKNRISNILAQFEGLIENCLTGNYHYEFDSNRFITPTTPNLSSGYSVTALNLRWTTTSNILQKPNN